MTFIFNKLPVESAVAELCGVDFRYPQTDVFRGLTVSVARASMTAVTGSNGSGKSTLLGLLAGVLQPDHGRVRVRVADIAYAVQRSEVTDGFPITAAEAVMMGRWRHLGMLRRPTRYDRAAVDHWLGELGIADLRRRPLGELSGGQRQRVLLAQAFVQHAELLLVDEATTGLDADSRDAVVGHLRRLADTGTTVVVATHDRDVLGAADHRIDLGRVAAD